MKMVLDNKQNIPYSLHDMYITEFNVIVAEEGNAKGTLELCFENGVIETTPPYDQTDRMVIRIEQVDLDFCDAQLIFNDYGAEMETFSGKRLRLEKLGKEYSEFHIEVLDELYGYNSVVYRGYLHVAGEERLISIEISIYYEGDITYLTDK